MKIAFLSGTSLAGSSLFEDWDRSIIETRYGEVSYRRRKDFVMLNRHGPDGATPPHSINHRANIRALVELGFTDIVSLASVGSLQDDLEPGTLVSCNDYVSFRPETFHDDRAMATTPEIRNHLIPAIARALPWELPCEKVYVQTRGPRFETKAEIRVLRGWGDVVGMTAASEADLCREENLRYNCLCMVDNYANGIGPEGRGPDCFRELVRRNQEKVDTLFRMLLDLFAGRGPPLPQGARGAD